MKTGTIAFVFVLAALAMPSTAAAQTTSGCFANFNIEPSSWNKVDGADTHIGDVDLAQEVGTVTSIGTNLSGSLATEPLIVKLQPKLFLTADGGCVSKGGLGFEVSGYRYQSDGNLSGTVGSVTSSNNNYQYGAIYMWDRQIPQPLNKFQPNGRAPINYDGTANLKIQRFDVLGVYNFVNSNQAILGVFGGLGVLKYASGQLRQLQTEGFLPDHFTPNGIFDGFTFTGQSQAEGTLMGPTIGAHFTGIIGKPSHFGIALNARFSHTWAKGTVNETGNWTDYEVGELGLVSGGVASHGPILFTNNESVPLNRSSHDSVQVTDLEASARVRLFHGCLEIGPGITLSRLDNLPVAANWSLPMGTSLANSTWKNNSSTISLSGLAISIGAKISF